MESQTRKCPVCDKPLTQEEYDKALGIWKAKHEEIKHLEKERADLKQQAALLKKEKAESRRANKRLVTEQKRKFAIDLRLQRKLDKEATKNKITSAIAKEKSKSGQVKRNLEIQAAKTFQENKLLKERLDQYKKGITPQIEGLLEEDKLLAKLRELFPHDHFDHPGKGGDIIQTVMEHDKPVGKIVYECKKVKSFSQSHVKQAADARELRGADFAVLVTNAFPAKRQSYFVSNTVYVISPVNVEAVTHTLRESLVKIALLRLSNVAKEKAVNEIYKYMSGNEYGNKVNGMAAQLLTLREDLRSEFNSHMHIWKRRNATYKNLFTDLTAIDSKLRELLALGEGRRVPKLTAGQQKTYPPLEELERK
ncbi:MAG: DUF2130 domain-containing protein [bacterium]|nr:DUF2130 domain-containing protein [bacterium]